MNISVQCYVNIYQNCGSVPEAKKEFRKTKYQEKVSISTPNVLWQLIFPPITVI